MGGFHGGHSGGGGGGFHGGSHHSSYHSSSSRPAHVHTVVHGVHYIDGRRYYGAYYGMGSSGKPRSFFTNILIGLILLFASIVAFVIIATPKTTLATVTYTYKVGSGYDAYECYDFEYSYNGNKYKGYGDDDLNSDGTFNVVEGESYTLYLHIYSNSSYEFSNQTGAAFVVSGILLAISAFLIISTVNTYIKHKKRLAEVGDANGDGVVNDADLKYVDNKNDGKADGVYDGARAATADNTYDEMRKDPRVTCPYCGSLVDNSHSFCPNCGGRLNDK